MKKSNTAICPSCGAENPAENKFCESCGVAMEQDDTSAASKKKSKKKIIIAITVGVLLLAAVTVAGIFFAGDNEEAKYNTKITEADKYLEDQDYEKAETAYLEAIDIDPKQEPAYIKLADTYVEQHKEGEALSILETAIQELPDSKKIKAKYDEIDASDYVQAMKAYDEFLSQDTITVGDSIGGTNVWHCSSCDFALPYISNDDIPELMLYNFADNDHASGYGAIFQYRDGEVKLLGRLSLNDVRGIGYYRGTGYFMDQYASTGLGDITTNHIDDLESIDGITNMMFGMSMEYDSDDTSQIAGYYVGRPGEQGFVDVSKSEYDKALKKATNNVEMTQYKFFHNTEENREKQLLQ